MWLSGNTPTGVLVLSHTSAGREGLGVCNFSIWLYNDDLPMFPQEKGRARWKMALVIRLFLI